MAAQVAVGAIPADQPLDSPEAEGQADLLARDADDRRARVSAHRRAEGASRWLGRRLPRELEAGGGKRRGRSLADDPRQPGGLRLAALGSHDAASAIQRGTFA